MRPVLIRRRRRWPGWALAASISFGLAYWLFGVEGVAAWALTLFLVGIRALAAWCLLGDR